MQVSAASILPHTADRSNMEHISSAIDDYLKELAKLAEENSKDDANER